MIKLDQRLNDVISDLSPEDKAKVAIEDSLRLKPVIPPTDYRKMLDAMTAEEGHRFNAFIKRFQTLRSNLDYLAHRVAELQKDLLNRDRTLWYLRGLEEVEEAISFDSRSPGASKVLLVDNPNIRPGEPLKLRVTLATVSLGVWGKQRIPIGKKSGVELTEQVDGFLTVYAAVIRARAANIKSIFRYVEEEATDMGLDFMRGMAIEFVDDVAKHDRSMKRIAQESATRTKRWNKEGLTHEEQLERTLKEGTEPIGACVFPVDDKWALEWDEVEEDEDTARLIREAPESWLEASHSESDEGLLDHFKAIARNQP